MTSSVTIIMPSFNSSGFIEESIVSVIKQTYEDWILIISDDNSTDSTVEIVNKLQQLDNRIILIQSDVNKGAAEARNAALKLVKSEFIAFLDSDDLWTETKLSDQIEFMEKSKIDFSYTWYQKFSNSGMRGIIKSPKKVKEQDLLSGSNIGCSSVMLSSKLVGGSLMPNLRKRQDLAFWILLLGKSKSIAKCFPEVRMLYRCDSGMTKNKFRAATAQWYFYRSHLCLNKRMSSFYFLRYALNGLWKYLK